MQGIAHLIWQSTLYCPGALTSTLDSQAAAAPGLDGKALLGDEFVPTHAAPLGLLQLCDDLSLLVHRRCVVLAACT